MNPVLFDKTIVGGFASQGIGTLDCVSCFVTEERNGIYELTARVRMESRHFEHIKEGNIIAAHHSNKHDRQPFQIYKVRRTLDGFAEIYAEHISYRLNKYTVMPCRGLSSVLALEAIKDNTVEDNPFTYYTDIRNNNAVFNIEIPSTVKSRLHGNEGSFTDVYGGELEYDNYEVRILKSRGKDNGVTLRYGKNITELAKETDISDIYTSIIPYWTGTDDDDNDIVVTIQGNRVRSEYAKDFPTERSVPVDFTSDFDERPTDSQLREKALEYLEKNVKRQLLTKIKTSFLELGITDEYKGRYALESVDLCDWVTISYPALGISDKAQVVKVVYNVLLDRNESVELGELKKTLADLFGNKDAALIDKLSKKLDKAKKETDKRLDKAEGDIINIDNRTTNNETNITNIGRRVTNNETKITNIDNRIINIINNFGDEINRLENIINGISNPFPVGSIYLSIEDVNPSTYFGGTWVQIDAGSYLISASSLNVDTTGGSAEHFHDYTYQLVAKNDFGSFKPDGSWSTSRVVETVMPVKNRRIDVQEYPEDGQTFRRIIFNDSDAVSVTVMDDIFHEFNTGETENAKNEPPYYAVYVWKRTA